MHLLCQKRGDVGALPLFVPSSRHIWKMVGLYYWAVQFDDPVEAFLDLLRLRAEGVLSYSVVIHVAYIVQHIWLSRNKLVFESRRISAGFILERATTLASEMMDVTWSFLAIWDSHSALGAI